MFAFGVFEEHGTEILQSETMYLAKFKEKCGYYLEMCGSVLMKGKGNMRIEVTAALFAMASCFL